MNSSTSDDLRPRAPDRLSRGAVLALAAHGVLLVGLTLGVAWRSSEPEGVEAELWAAVPQTAAPRAVPPPPAPEPAPPPPAPPRVEAPPPPPPPERDAEIAREKREQERLEQQRLNEERARQEREKQARLDREKAERDKRERQKAEEETKRREAERKKAEDERKRRAEAAETKRLAELREENLRRLNAQVTGSGSADSTGTAAQSAGPSAGYAGRIKARIKPNIVFAEEVAGNPVAAVEVQVAPDGTIIGRRLTRSSGIAAWDEAVLRAIDRTEVLPRDTDGRVPPSMLIEFRPRDL